MNKPDKQRVGLQRKVSSVFKGVNIPGAKRTGEPSPPVSNSDSNCVSPPKEVTKKDHVPGVRSFEDDSPRAISPEPETTKEPASEGHALIEKATKNVGLKTTADSAPRVPEAPQTAPGSLAKKLTQSEEPNDTGTFSPSDSTEPEVEKASMSGKTIGEKKGHPAKQAPKSKPTPQSSLMKRLAQSEEPANEAVSDSKADVHLPKAPKREPSFNRKLKNERKPEAYAASTSQNKHPLADQLANAVDDEGFLQQIKEKLMPSEGGSTKDKVMVMLVPILAIVMVFAFRHVLEKPPSKASAAKKNDEKVVTVNKSDGEIEWKIPDPLPAMTRDPLQLPQDEDTEKPDDDAVKTTQQQGNVTTAAQIRNGVVHVRTIVYSEDKASALVGGSIVYPGSKINDVTVVKINRDSVEFESNGETWVQKVRD